MAIRLKDIASELGVSTVTVSKVLRGNHDIGPQTRARVLKRMRELNYQPNMLARGLATGCTYTVGLVVPDLVHPFFAEFARSLSGHLRESHRALILASSEDDPQVEMQEIRTLLNRGVDVLIIASCQANLRNFYQLGDNHTPYLLFDRNFSHLAANFVGSDDLCVGRIATEHLLGLGRRRIAHLGGRKISTSFDRLRGYKLALNEVGVAYDDSLVLGREKVEESGDVIGAQMMTELLARRQRPDAVFCYNDLTAIGAIDAILTAGLRVPEDIAVIGCGNMRYAKYLRVPLSSVDHHTAELGRRAAELTLELSVKPEQDCKTILTAPSVVARASTIGVPQVAPA